ncbi:hypothetical protein ACFO4E_19075 [Nocardiopsis mangrovi]|uniref:Uncharacterized protein n=1 Tax=Nocardiopsis mangrovi TaxID=1179818 RepID=A0ABV9DYJ2_9ACTN
MARALTDPGDVRDLDAGDRADGSSAEVPCESADAEYSVILRHSRGPDATGPRDPSESCEGGDDVRSWDRVVETPDYNLCPVHLP